MGESAPADMMSPHIKYAHQVSAVGKQSLSTRATTPSYSFGSRREADVFVTKVRVVASDTARGCTRRGTPAQATPLVAIRTAQ